jgi:hypothetical protein
MCSIFKTSNKKRSLVYLRNGAFEKGCILSSGRHIEPTQTYTYLMALPSTKTKRHATSSQ